MTKLNNRVMKEKKKSSFAVLMHYAGGHKYYSYASAVLAVISAWIALIPFYDVWRIIKEILRVRPDATDEEVMAARWLRQARLRSLKRLKGYTSTWLRCSFARRNGNTDLNMKTAAGRKLSAAIFDCLHIILRRCFRFLIF